MLNMLVIAALAVFGAFFAGAAVLKLIRHRHMVDEFEQMKMPYAFAYLSASVEIVMGPLMIVGIWVPGLAGIAASVMVCTMIGAALVNLIGRGVKMAVGVLFVFATPMALLAFYHLAAAKAWLGLQGG